MGIGSRGRAQRVSGAGAVSHVHPGNASCVFLWHGTVPAAGAVHLRRPRSFLSLPLSNVWAISALSLISLSSKMEIAATTVQWIIRREMSVRHLPRCLVPSWHLIIGSYRYEGTLLGLKGQGR